MELRLDIIYWILLILHALETFQARNIDEGVYASHFRRKRETQCEEKYRVITTGHSACLPPSSKFVSKGAGVSDEEKRIIVDKHNTVRREVSPMAKNMMLMHWDDEIARTAQRWAEGCIIDHDKGYKRYAFGRFSVGQNLAWGSWPMGWSSAIQLWADEKDDYSYETNSSPTRKVIGHYTQMVWATSITIGCGYALCGTTHYYVCNYGPSGNSNGVKPYLSGRPCGDCPNSCNNGLCDCGKVVCLNGGEMDPNTCSCTCKSKDFHLQPYCGLNCTNIKDPSHCTQQWGVSYCERYTNVPQDCPSMCKWCPSAAYKYEEVSSALRTTCSILVVTLCALLWFT